MEILPKIALIGYGSMGKELERLALEHNYVITDIFEIDNPIDINENYNFDVAIDFSFPNSVVDNVKKIATLNKNIVVGTTGWYNNLQEISIIVEENNIGMIYGAVFSVGMQIFYSICDVASKFINDYDMYDANIYEIHHKRKKDSPSGTGLKLGELVLQNIDRKKKMITEKLDGAISSEELQISSSRVGEVVGTHKILFDSIFDSIELIHTSKNRQGFVLGALMAANWINGKKGVFDFMKIFKEIQSI